MKYLIILLLFISCGTRNADTTKHATENINIENTYSLGSKIVLNDVFTFTPSDISKPMILDGKSYQNTIIKSDKSKSKIQYFNIKEKIIIHTSRNIVKTTTRTNHDFLYLGMFLIVVIAVFLWFKTVI